jgi:hypothetical protein
MHYPLIKAIASSFYYACYNGKIKSGAGEIEKPAPTTAAG